MDQLDPSLLARARRVLHSEAAPFALAALVFVMSLPSLRLGFQLDDRTYMRLFDQGRGPLNLLYESQAGLLREKGQGVFAWWAGPHFAIHFIRPLSALTHFVEWTLWPHAAWAMHLTNCVLYALLVAVAAACYRLLLPSTTAFGLAALMFAVDDSHAQSVGWIASRHVIVSTLFGLAALYLHVRARVPFRASEHALRGGDSNSAPALRGGELDSAPALRGGARAHPVLSLAAVACTALTLLASEYGLATLAYLLAYALVFESGSWFARVRSIWPHALVCTAWAVGYLALGGGVHDASWFRDPASAPFDTLLQGIADVPLWLLSQLGGDTANVALVLPQTWSRVLSVLFVLPVLALLRRALSFSRAARFCALGMLLSLVPLFATVPQDRLMTAASFGGFGWIACLIGNVGDYASSFVRTAAQAFRIPHLIIAPLAFIPLLGGLSAIDATSQALAQAAPTRGAKQAIIVNLPIELLTNTSSSLRPAPIIPLHQLYAGFSKLTVRRPDARTLELSSETAWGARPLQRMFTARASMPKLHEVRALDGLRATVIAVDGGGLPTRVRFEFDDALESRERVWLVWKGARPAPWKPPPIGKQVSVPSPSMLGLVL